MFGSPEVADCVALDQDDPCRHQGRIGARLFFVSLDLADGLVRDAQMNTGDATPQGKWRKNMADQRVDRGRALGSGDIEAHRQHRPATADTPRKLHTTN